MDKNQTSRGALFGAFSTRNRQLLWARSYLLALFLALGWASFQLPASAQNCFQECQRIYVQCLYDAFGDPVMEAICDDHYDACCEDCL
jgi:hypothetical protein